MRFQTASKWGDPYSQKIWQLQPPLSGPLPHPLGAERNPHTQRRGSPPWPSALSQTHTGGQAGCRGIWERYTGNAREYCVSISLFRNANSFPQPSCLYPVPWVAYWPMKGVYLTGLMGPTAHRHTWYCCAYTHCTVGIKWQQHLYSLTSHPSDWHVCVCDYFTGTNGMTPDLRLEASCQWMHSLYNVLFSQ